MLAFIERFNNLLCFYVVRYIGIIKGEKDILLIILSIVI